MKTLFVMCIVLGVLWLLLEQALKNSSPAPSMYPTSGNGWALILLGVIGAACVTYFTVRLVKMKNFLVRITLAFLFLAPVSALAQGGARVVTSCGILPQAYSAGSNQPPTVDVNGVACSTSSNQYPGAATAITGNAAGTTGAVVGTLAAAAAKTTYICGFSVDAIGGTAAVGPITVAGLITASMVFQLTSSATGVSRAVTFAPCIPASAANTAITITTTANGTASAVNVNSWGMQQ